MRTNRSTRLRRYVTQLAATNWVVFVGVLLLSGVAIAAEAPTRVSWGQSFSDVVSLPAGAPVRKVFYGDAPEQFAELWLPANSNGPLPVIALIHGGCWLADYDISHVYALSEALTERGYAVWSIEYRRHGSPGAAWPDPIDDVVTAITSLSDQPDRRLDLSRVALVGHSAGGHLALLAATRLQHSTMPSLRGVVGLAAISDLTRYGAGDNSCQSVLPEMLGGSPQAKPEFYALASPVTQPVNIDTHLLHGDADTIVPLGQSRDMPGASVAILPGAGHFDLIHPHTPAFEILAEHLRQLLAPVKPNS